MSPAQLLLQDY